MQLLALCSALLALASASEQSIGVKGQLMCGDQPLASADVKLWLLHTFPRPDTNLATVKTDAEGKFQLCQRESTHKIPSSYISKSGQVDKWYDMGTMNVEAKQKGEESHCASNPLRALGRK